MTLYIAAGKFPLGQIVITRGAHSELSQEDVFGCLTRHAIGDWGDLDEFDRAQNEAALKHGDRLLSQYSTPSGTVFWIITECDRSATTILLPEEY